VNGLCVVVDGGGSLAIRW